MKVHICITIDHEILEAFKKNCDDNAYKRSTIIERLIKSFNEKTEADKKKNEGGMNNGNSSDAGQGTL